MRTADNAALKWTIAVISAVIGAGCGIFGGPLGMIAGGVSGLFFGYFYVPLLLSLKNEYALAVVLARIIAGTTYGSVAGLISGALVYLPAFLLEESNPIFGGAEKAMGMGAFIGVIVGTPLGFLLSLVISISGALVTVCTPKEKIDSTPADDQAT